MFNELSTQEHMVLLMMYNSVPIPESLFLEEKKSLFEKTLTNKVKGEFYINTRGIAFVHQQRDPRNLDKYKKASIPFLAKLEKVAKEGLLETKAEELTKALFDYKLIK